MSWRVITHRMPAGASRHRVVIWRATEALEKFADLVYQAREAGGGG